MWGDGEMGSVGEIKKYIRTYAPSVISSRGEWHSPPTDSVWSKNLRKFCIYLHHYRNIGFKASP
ncbi:MAG: hypothetical protein SWX82_30595 [Cyanobacteriota bacterium]|nr:hypothetical protein [Cyanobacteriota bacterium]